MMYMYIGGDFFPEADKFMFLDKRREGEGV